ncbi:hypothetical protein [Sinomicrobium weinanense]|uniref:DoxX family protein n=1 Tax=Sinomicrobium weinanense TaxID=2842200 RepID=A0A926JUI7_9FLAO|nr:hypothetical protein [Sinomicrobium weinanense]MBC9797629.1 hypothetical protein [Sinomicrobium weinanense]MBU3125249.1 hypothetical protein [Sinomicrobium weinanense]
MIDPSTTTTTEPQWNTAEKTLFRLVFCYYVLFLFPFPFQYIPFKIGDHISSWIDGFWQWMVLLISKDIFHIVEEIPGGNRTSGDTTFDFLKLFTRLCIAAFAVLIWSLLDHKKKNYSGWLVGLIIALRYYLAFSMLTYGFSKVFLIQFWDPTLFDLITPHGNSSPMGLLWKFMGNSHAYSIFTGAAEVIAGILLMFRPTVRLGALMCFGIMLNVFLLNMSYDVPVKLYSAHLVLMAAFILLPDARNLLRFFIRNKPVAPVVLKPYFQKRGWNVAGYIFKGIVLIYIIGSNLYGKITREERPLPALYGIYETERFISGKDTLPSLTKDGHRWKRLVIDRWRTGIEKMDGNIQYVRNETDTVHNTLKLVSFRDTTFVYDFTYTVKDSVLLLNGYHHRDTLKIQFQRKDRTDFLLINRGFHWINEYSFNR